MWGQQTDRVNQELMVVEGNRPNLLGRDVLNKIQIDWMTLFKGQGRDIKTVYSNELNNMLSNYESVFDTGLGTMKGVEVEIKVTPKAKPLFICI